MHVGRPRRADRGADTALGRSATDHELVSAVRRGDDRAFEALYARYQRRITAYVLGMVNDHGRAEDITQEVFVSALRRMRQTERPIAFKPWIYEIARNACIDAYRRGRARGGGLLRRRRPAVAPTTAGSWRPPQPDAAADAKQELDHLRGAFGGLSTGTTEILVLRELEGRSYNDIGERMGMSRPAVESTLFRARKRLSEEYDELASGARCLRVQRIVEGDGRRGWGRASERRVARHLSHCQPCRRARRAGRLAVPARRRLARPDRRLAAAARVPVVPASGGAGRRRRRPAARRGGAGSGADRGRGRRLGRQGAAWRRCSPPAPGSASARSFPTARSVRSRTHGRP